MLWKMLTYITPEMSVLGPKTSVSKMHVKLSNTGRFEQNCPVDYEIGDEPYVYVNITYVIFKYAHIT